VSRADGGPVVVYEGLFRDIVPGERIVVANWIDADGQRISISQFTAEFRAKGNGTRLVVTEQGAYLDGHDSPDSRAIGIRAQLRNCKPAPADPDHARAQLRAVLQGWLTAPPALDLPP
jgi:uncharacterized protein YndB with AHSA1/START domain